MSPVLDGIRVGGYSRSGWINDQIVPGNGKDSLIVGIGLCKGQCPGKWAAVAPCGIDSCDHGAQGRIGWDARVRRAKAEGQGSLGWDERHIDIIVTGLITAFRKDVLGAVDAVPRRPPNWPERSMGPGPRRSSAHGDPRHLDQRRNSKKRRRLCSPRSGSGWRNSRPAIPAPSLTHARAWPTPKARRRPSKALRHSRAS